ncbi:FMN-binding negative transcriptional regulator [Aerolutibacter daejeonensis]|uniref:FMN-binding negative transcriptional regulator n=1 Tax=Aerolutibacter daejeonensis TaxID=346181 RepID=UPI000690D95E|nr:FMN-binding negative transcriptional regulator [Lysobacter daejeonensis]
MKTSPIFKPTTEAINRLVEDFPFAQLVSMCDGAPICTPLPLLLARNGEECWLIGHFARGNPQVEMLRRSPRALAIFMGPQGYVSPSWMRDRTQAPTWNYATVHIDIEVAFDDGPEDVHAALSELVQHMERGRPSAWTAMDMGERYARLSAAVVAFRARVLAVNAKFKLGQNERDDVFADILAGLRRTGEHDLADAMERHGTKRGA